MNLESLTIFGVSLLQPLALGVFVLTAIILRFSLSKPTVPDSYPAPLNWLLKERRAGAREVLLRWGRTLSAIVMVASCSVAALRPAEILSLESEEQARSIIIALDLSRSMATADFSYRGERTSRMEGVKLVVGDYLAHRSQDRIGLVVFGANAFLQSPLTRDFGLLRQLVSSLQVGVAGDGTAIGEGLGLAVKRAEAAPAQSRAVVLITDGVNNSGNVQPLQAAAVARDLGVRVYTIGIGAQHGEDGGGAPEFDSATLQKIAETTGGLYRDASSFDSLADIYNEIEEREATQFTAKAPRAIIDLFTPWSVAALGALILYLILGSAIRYRPAISEAYDS